MMSGIQPDTLQAWSESAPFWVQYRDTIRTLFAPITHGLLEAAEVAPGHNVLDVAGGTGDPALALAEAVAPGGRVVCSDGTEAMVRGALQQSRERSGLRIHCLCCTGGQLPFADRCFDRVVCRLGVMLFAEPEAAVAEMLRVLRPGGRLALAVWSASAANPFFETVTRVLNRHQQDPDPDPLAPGAFRFAAAGSLAAVLEGAGAVQVTERFFPFRIEAYMTTDQFWTLRSRMSDTLRERLARLTPDLRRRVEEEVKQAVEDFRHPDRLSFPGEVVLVSGCRPATRTRLET